ncbi:Protein CBG19954 [Caenorhabditis briggsae]|uniref:Protein CBG19954 n=2 Tax=Caenorhabditis briggsae TaxID=6238 RepID=A8XWT1_CAEBR|nr:Protein CBG19954 [Caenorhabditis briggsae]ULT94379.1 hypothetical protein L3Y34_003685 [Caenorhabditis briggsae]CAP37100.1 Protein CBG19954 [Caenorhabditis briggsae]
MFSITNGHDSTTTTMNTIQSCYSREKMLILNTSPICYLRPPYFHTVVRELPELIRLAPSPDEIVTTVLTESTQ